MGRLRWSFKAGSMLACSPAVGPDGTVYVGCRDGKLYAVDAQGSLRFTVETDGPVDAAPCVHPDGLVVFGSYDGVVRALDPDGAERWRLGVGAPVMTTPCVDAAGQLWFGADDGALRAVTPEGRLLAQVTVSDLISASPVCAGDAVLLAGEGLYGTDGTRVETVAREPVVAAAAVGADGTVYYGAWDGYAYAVRDGKVAWNTPVEGQVYASCAVGDDLVLTATRAGWVYGLALDGGLRWKRKLGDGVYGTPAIASGGVCFVGCNDNRVYALALDSGEIAWQERVGRDVRSSVALADDGTVFAASWDWSLYAFDGGAGGPADVPWPQFQHDAARTGRRLPAAPAAPSPGAETRPD